MENKTLDKDQPSRLLLSLEIPLYSCSNIQLFEQLRIFLQQNNIPIQIHTHIPSSSIQKGGEKETNSNYLTYQSDYSPFTIFSQFMDRLFLQKQHENTEDTKNKKLLDSMFSKDKSKKEMIDSLAQLSKKQKQMSREEENEKNNTQNKPIPIPIIIPIAKKNKRKESEDTNTLYMKINTNQSTPIESIKGTKLYYLYQRQQNGLCGQFV